MPEEGVSLNLAEIQALFYAAVTRADGDRSLLVQSCFAGSPELTAAGMKSFQTLCASCHGGSGGLSLASCANLQAGGISGPSNHAPITAVKVTTCDPIIAFTSTAVKGVDWVTANARRPAVANMSIPVRVRIVLSARLISWRKRPGSLKEHRLSICT